MPPPTNFYKRVVQEEDAGPMARGLSNGGAVIARMTRSAGEARLSYVLGWPGVVQAAVFDAMGRRVRTLFSGQQAAGEHSLAWDFTGAEGQRVGAGLYFVALDFNGTRSMMKVPVW